MFSLGNPEIETKERKRELCYVPVWRPSNWCINFCDRFFEIDRVKISHPKGNDLL